jgi:hypothetical protein
VAVMTPLAVTEPGIPTPEKEKSKVAARKAVAVNNNAAVQNSFPVMIVAPSQTFGAIRWPLVNANVCKHLYF